MGLKVAIVGAGLGGLAAAIELAAAGMEVEVFDARPGPGGKAFTERLGEWRFDTGPSLLTLVAVFRDLLSVAGESLEDHLTPVPLEPVCHYWFADGTTFRAGAGPQGLAQSLVEAGLVHDEEIQRFLSYARRLWETAGPLFLEHPMDLGLLRQPLFWKSVLKLPFLDVGRTLWQALESFFHDQRARQYFARYATYNGSSPFKAPATLNLIPWAESLGAYGVREGIYAIPLMLERIGRKLGVSYQYSRRVVSIETNGGAVSGLRLEGEERLRYVDAVVSAVDVHETYRLLRDAGSPWNLRYKRLEPSSSGFVFYWGMDREFPQLGLNNIFFSSDYQREFREIFEEGRVPTEPTVYVNVGCRVTPEDAPRGAENWFVLVNAPPDRGQDWKAEGQALRERVLRLLEQRLGTSVARHIVVEGSWDPRSIGETTSSRGGSLYGLSSNSPNAAFRRHPNRHPHYRRLYQCGGSAHPGGGMPLAVLGGRLAARLLLEDWG